MVLHSAEDCNEVGNAFLYMLSTIENSLDKGIWHAYYLWYHPSVKNPGISYSEFPILIPGSRVIFTWSLLHYSYYEGLDPYLLSMAPFWHHMVSLLDTQDQPMALSPLIDYQGCVSTYIPLHTCTNSTEQYIRLALQPVSITNYLVLVPSSSQLWAHSHYAQVALHRNQDTCS